MQETALPCKPYPKQHRDCKRSAAARRTFYDFVSGLCGLNRRAIAGLDRLSSQQNPAYVLAHFKEKENPFPGENWRGVIFVQIKTDRENLSVFGR